MTTINLNNKVLEKEFNSNSSLDDLIDNILSNNDGNQVLTEIILDGVKISLSSDDEACSKAISNYQEINLSTRPSIDLAFEALDSCNKYVDIVIQKIQKISNNFSNNNIAEANAEFADVIEILDLFIQLMTRINKTIHSQGNIKFEKSEVIKKLEIHLLAVLKALIPAREKNDIIMLSDLLEYELVDNLTQWKIKAIPDLKKLRTN